MISACAGGSETRPRFSIRSTSTRPRSTTRLASSTARSGVVAARGARRAARAARRPALTRKPSLLHLRASLQYNPARSPFLRRTNMFCGFRTAQPFASCGHLKNCFANFTSLDGFDECLEFDVHANLHAMHAGMWDCSVDVSQVRPARPRACDARARSSARRALFPPTQWIATMGPSISTDLMSFVVLTLPTLLADRESNFPWLFCPTSCALNATACRCTSSIGNLDRMSDNEVYKNLYNALQYMQNGAYLGDVRRRRARGRRAPALLLARALIRGRPPPRGSATSKSSMTGRSSSARRRARSRRATTRNSNGSCSRSEQRARTRARARARRARRARRAHASSRARRSSPIRA